MVGCYDQVNPNLDLRYKKRAAPLRERPFLCA